MKYKKIAIIASNTPKAQECLEQINAKYNFIKLKSFSDSIKNIDLILILGGDGFMLDCLHNYINYNIPLYGLNCGTVGFLLNNFNITNLLQRLENAVETVTHPLEMKAYISNGEVKTYCAINEVSLFRNTNQAAKIEIKINEEIRLPELVCDGVLLSTPAGSTAYNSSVHGPILPIGSNILALTPISPFRPKRWSGAILPHTARVTFTILEPQHRPVNAVADFFEVTGVSSVEIVERRDISLRLLFDPNHSLEERIIKEQFA